VTEGRSPSNDYRTFRLGAFDSHGTTRAPLGGRQIEVEHGIPGETVVARRAGRGRARIVEIVDPAEDRTEPPCPYFRDWACGGCQWQHITYEGQLRRKREMVETTMRESGLPFGVGAVRALDDSWRYRTTAGISLGKRAGFRRHGSLAIVPIRDCPISHPLIGHLMAALNDRLDVSELPDFHGRMRIDVRVAQIDGVDRLQALVRSTDPGAMPPANEVETLLTALADISAVAGITFLASDGRVTTVREPVFAATQVGGKPVLLTASSFFQTNIGLLEILIQRLQAEAQTVPNARVADIYGGVGVFGLFLSDDARDVMVVESDPDAVEAGRRTARAWGVTNVHFVEGKAETHLRQTPGYDVAVLDPPRSGLSDEVLEMVRDGAPHLILYISCLAQSLARDLIELGAAGYRLDALELFDFYPQTYHVELLAVLRKEQTILHER